MHTATNYFCSICGNQKSGNGWFLLKEDRWLDRVKVMQWNEILARQPGVHCLCSASHVRESVAHWMATGSLDYPFARALASENQATCSVEVEPSEPGPEVPSGHVIGELAVHRESLERVLCQNPRSLSSILEALLDALRGESSEIQSRAPGKEDLVLV